MNDSRLHSTLLGLDSRRGDETRYLQIGDRQIMLDGLDPTLCELLSLRWGGFVGAERRGDPALEVRLFRAGSIGWLERKPSGERYRMEAINDQERRVIVSYNFAICAEADPGVWRVAVKDEPDEPVDRLLDNVLRYFAARFAVQQGGVAMHAAGLLRDGKAYVLAGPSRAGKSTAVSLAGTARSLGDDLALVVRRSGGWAVPALPFDNSERVVHEIQPGPHPLAGIWRLHQASNTRIEHPSRGLAVASLMGVTAFPWAVPELADPLLEQVKQLIDEGKFAHLHFSKGQEFWTHLDALN